MPCSSLTRSVQKVNQANMLLLEELRESPSEKSAGRQCSNEPGIKTPSGTLYLCGFGDASLRKHSTTYCGLRLVIVFSLIKNYPTLRKHSTTYCGLRPSTLWFDLFLIQLRKHSTTYCGLRHYIHRTWSCHVPLRKHSTTYCGLRRNEKCCD